MKQVLCKNINDNLFAEAWQLYQDSFPIEEKRMLIKHKEAIQDSRFYPYVYVEDNGNFIGLCFYWSFTSFIYIEHFAITKIHRDKGIGSKIISNFSINSKPVILEVEPPVSNESKKRIEFYKRNNFNQTAYKFKQLQYKKTNNKVLLDLLCNKVMDGCLYNKFELTIYKELNKYC